MTSLIRSVRMQVRSRLVFQSKAARVEKKAKRCVYLPSNFEHANSLVECMDSKLFHNVLYNPHHVLNQLLPPVKDTTYNLSLIHI